MVTRNADKATRRTTKVLGTRPLKVCDRILEHIESSISCANVESPRTEPLQDAAHTGALECHFECR